MVYIIYYVYGLNDVDDMYGLYDPYGLFDLDGHLSEGAKIVVMCSRRFVQKWMVFVVWQRPGEKEDAVLVMCIPVHFRCYYH